MSISLAAERTGGRSPGRDRAGRLELAGLRRRYGRTAALDGLSFTVEPGRIFGFLGPNGAGKTTAMRIVMGIELPDAGAVCWGGRLLPHADRLAFGYMPGQRGLYPKMRVRDHVAYLARLHGLTAEQAAAGDRWLRRLGIGAQAYAQVEALSHGNQQRVQLAAALVHDPQVVVLDEPFSGLDPLGIEDMAHVLRELAHQGVTVAFSSHKLDLVEDICEQVAIIDRGKVVLADAVRALKHGGSPTLVLEVEGAGADWCAGLPTAAGEHAGPGRVRVTFHDADPQVVLDRARGQHGSAVRPRGIFPVGVVPPGGRAISTVSAVRLVAGRELRERGRSKVFWVGTSVSLLGVAAAILAPAVLGHHGQQSFRVGTVGTAPPGLSSSIIADAAALGGRAHIRAIGSAAQARSALDTQALDLVIEGQTGVLMRGQGTDPAAAGLAHLMARDLAVQARLLGAFSTAPAPVRSLTPVTPGHEASKAIVVLGTIILYLSLATYGGWVTSGVLEEKSSRVAEVILAAVRPRELLAGKVIGIGLLGLAQFAAVALTATIAAIAVGRHLPASTPGAIGLIVAWFLLGYAFYCSAFAAAGAASSRQAEVPAVAGPLSLLILLGYVVALSVQSNPNGLLARITSFVPPARPDGDASPHAAGPRPPWELPASAAVMLAATYGLMRLAGRAYSGNILRFGGRVTSRGMRQP